VDVEAAADGSHTRVVEYFRTQADDATRLPVMLVE